MSQMIPIQQLNIQHGESSALALALRGELAAEVFDYELPEEDEHNDFVGITPTVSVIKANSAKGVFVGRDQDEREAPSTLYGVILARQTGRIFFTPDEKSTAFRFAKQARFESLLEEEKWICRCANVGQPKTAALNPVLNAQQKAEAIRLEIGGATGRGCLECPAGQWSEFEGENIRLCKNSESVVWLDSKMEEPVVITMAAASCVKGLEAWMKAQFSKGRPLPVYRNLLKMEMVRVKSDKAVISDWFALQIQEIEKLDRETISTLAQARSANLYLLAKNGQAEPDRAGFELDPAMEPAAEVDPFTGVL